MRATPYITVLTVATLLLVGGCAPQRRCMTRQTPPRNLLFSPAWTGIPTHDMPRSPWPATVVGGPASEVVEYRTTLTDLQGHFGNRDRVYRRFYSVRTGAADRLNY